MLDPATGALHDWRIDGGADLRQRVDLMRQAPDGTVWLSVMNLGLQQRSAEAVPAAFSDHLALAMSIDVPSNALTTR